MKKLFSFLYCAVLVLPCIAEAKSTMGISRGGLGYIFTDNNSFLNPGQFSRSHEFGAEAMFMQQDKGGPQAGDVSAVWGNGKLGLGAYGARVGTKLNAPADERVDTAGVGLGLALAKDRLTLGAGYSRVLSAAPPDSGTLGVNLTLNPMAEKGFAVTLSGDSTIKPVTGRSRQSATVGVGYEFRANTSVEAFGTVNDFADAKDDTAGVAATLGGQYFYAGVLGTYNRMASNYAAAGRFGFIFGPVDFSVIAAKTLVTGSAWSYGGTVRFAF